MCCFACLPTFLFSCLFFAFLNDLCLLICLLISLPVCYISLRVCLPVFCFISLLVCLPVFFLSLMIFAYLFAYLFALSFNSAVLFLFVFVHFQVKTQGEQLEMLQSTKEREKQADLSRVDGLQHKVNILYMITLAFTLRQPHIEI